MCKGLITEFRALASAIATLTLVLCLSGSANAQSTDVGHPTLTSRQGCLRSQVYFEGKETVLMT
jgi:hypothetical protein